MRVKTGFTRRKRHIKILKLTSGYRMTRSKHYRVAKEASIHAGEYAFAGRKRRKRDFRKLWITRINGALTPHDLSYSQFMNRLKKANIALDRKIIAELISSRPEVFSSLVNRVKSS